MSELLPCPFCGGSAGPHFDEHWRVYCARCGSSTGIDLGSLDTRERRIAAWNTRVTAIGSQSIELPDIHAEGERLASETPKTNGAYLWTDLVGAIQTGIAEERARHVRAV